VYLHLPEAVPITARARKINGKAAFLQQENKCSVYLFVSLFHLFVVAVVDLILFLFWFFVYFLSANLSLFDCFSPFLSLSISQL
jgi:hypothetical protein